MLSRYYQRSLLRLRQLKASAGIKWSFTEDNDDKTFEEGLEKPQDEVNEQKNFDELTRELLKEILEQGSKLKCQNCLNAWSDFEKSITADNGKDLSLKTERFQGGIDERRKFYQSKLADGRKIKDQDVQNDSKIVLTIQEIRNLKVNNEGKTLFYGQVLEKFQGVLEQQKNPNESGVVLTMKKVDNLNASNGNDEIKTLLYEKILENFQTDKIQVEHKERKNFKEPNIVHIKKGMETLNEPRSNVDQKTSFCGCGQGQRKIQGGFKDKEQANLNKQIFNDGKKSILFGDGVIKSQGGKRDPKCLNQRDFNGGAKPILPGQGMELLHRSLSEQNKVRMGNKAFLSTEELKKIQGGITANESLSTVNEQDDINDPGLSFKKRTVLPKNVLDAVQPGINDDKLTLLSDEYMKNQATINKENLELMIKIRDDGSRLKCEKCLTTWADFEKTLTNSIEQAAGGHQINTINQSQAAPEELQEETYTEPSNEDQMDTSISDQRPGFLMKIKKVLSNIFLAKK